MLVLKEGPGWCVEAVLLRTPTPIDRKSLRGSVEPRVMPAAHGSISGDLSQHGLAPQGDVLVAQSRAHNMNVEKAAQTPPRRPLMTK